jgi:uncharacterized protein
VLENVHDVRLVRAAQLSARAAVDRGASQLGIAFFEHCLAVPANRVGYTVYSAAQLKTMQEVITVAVFTVFSITYLGASIRWNHLAAFACLGLAAFFAFRDWS